jgi:hypothetical protein
VPAERAPGPGEGCLSELALDEWLAGEGSADERAAWQAHVTGCEGCRRRHEQRAAFNRQYLAAARDLELAAARRAGASGGAAGPSVGAGGGRGPTSARVRSAWWVGSGALAAAASVALWLSSDDRDASLGVRSKGLAQLDFYVKSGESVRPGVAGQSVRPGDALRFVVPRAEERYLVLLGLDGRGESAVYFPEGAAGERVPADSESIGASRALPNSVVLDDAPGRERFIAVFCVEPPSVTELARELSERGHIAARPGCELAETDVSKASPGEPAP